MGEEWDDEVEKLETEVREMAKKISDYRKTLPDHLINFASGSDPLPSSSSERLLPGTEDQQKLIQLRDIVSRNAENISKVVKRGRECVERIHILDSLDGGRTIHPAFTRRRRSKNSAVLYQAI